MDDQLVCAIRRFTLTARSELEREVHEQLEGLFGWLPDGSFAPEGTYPVLKQDAEARETRARLERYAREEGESGSGPAEARLRLVREAAFTWLNRLVALRMLEERRLIKGSMGRLLQSNGFLFWLTAEGNEEAYQLHQQGELPVDARGEGPAHVAYRRYLLHLCGELSGEVSILFDPENLASRLFPRPRVLKSVVEAMDREDAVAGLRLAEAWQAGNEETVGWVYESFIADEKDAVFAGFDRREKVKPDQIPAATEVFTPRWVVRFLVQNSLGRLWMEMHSDSRLKEKLDYFVPADPVQRAPRLVREITFLDPACGSMHFGLMAFDLFAEMYGEELERAGQPGWPATPSVRDREEIAAAIIENNVHGIDLDLRAVQLSAFALFLRARTLNPRCAFTDRNLACANVEQITGGRLESLLKEAGLFNPIYERIFQSLAERFKDSDSLGSLLRPERDIEELAREEKQRALAGKQHEFDLPGRRAELFDNQEELDAFFERLSEEILARLDAAVRRSRARGLDAGHLVNEAAKGLRFARLVTHRYDVVATNPPYLDGRDQSETLKQYLQRSFEDGKRNLYAAFILRAVELTNESGYIGMITGQSFMFLSTYDKLRFFLRGSTVIRTMAHFDYQLFKQRVDTTAFLLRIDPHVDKREISTGTYFRLVKQRDAEAKRRAFEEALAALRAEGKHPLVYRYRQGDFDDIFGAPWVYWISDSIRRTFASMKPLGKLAQPRQGLATADNNRFLRFWWEVGLNRIGRGFTNAAEAEASDKRWIPYMKGGQFQRWHGNQTHVVNWKDDGAEIRCLNIESGKIASRPQNTEFYFRRGVTWTDLTSGRFSARLSPGGFIFDVKGSSAFPENVPFILGILNSSFANYTLNLINPTVSYQVGDLARLPVPASSSPLLESLVEQAVELAREESAEDETTYDFVAPPDWTDGPAALAARRDRLAAVERDIDEEVYRLYGIGPEDRRAIEAELSTPAEASGEAAEEAVGGEEEEPEPGAEEAEDRGELARRWVDYAVGLALGRFQPGSAGGLGRGRFSEGTAARLRGLSAPGGILPADPGQPLDLGARALAVLEVLLGAPGAAEVAGHLGAKGAPLEALQDWLARGFWARHKRRYRKRPVYWPLQSPKKRYTVWIFHERLSADTLPYIRGELVEPRIRLAEREARDLETRAAGERRLARLRDGLLELADDLRRFSINLKAAAESGYVPHIDDGVLLNAAPLHELLPSWPETRQAWLELKAGRYDWAGQAMAYWPERVRRACMSNRSLALAHGLAAPVDPAPSPRRGRQAAPRELLG